jgi:hypothetical protein
VLANELRDEFFAGAAFAGDENGGSRIGDLVYEFEKFEDARVLADEAYVCRLKTALVPASRRALSAHVD